MVQHHDNISADIPEDLAAADEALTRYGQWASDRHRRRQRCGSAEREYRPGGWRNDEARRAPAPIRMTPAEAMVCQRALARVQDIDRVVLAILYVPRRLPPEAQLRLLRIPPRLSQERHLRGLRAFWNIRKIMDVPVSMAPAPAPPSPTMSRPHVVVHDRREFEETIP